MKKALSIFLILLFHFLGMDACPMCQGGPSEDALTAYKLITVLLMALPVLGGGGIFWWISRRYRSK